MFVKIIFGLNREGLTTDPRKSRDEDIVICNFHNCQLSDHMKEGADVSTHGRDEKCTPSLRAEGKRPHGDLGIDGRVIYQEVLGRIISHFSFSTYLLFYETRTA
jgi:hypothetical protein